MIRIASEADVPEILEIYAPYVLNTTFSFEYEVPTLETFAARFQRITAQFPWLVWEERGVILGYAYGSRPFERAGYAWVAEVSIYLRPEVQGRGIGRRLYAALENLMTIQGYHLIYAIITGENTGSIAFHKKVGYEFLAEFPACGYKHGKNLSVIWMEKRLKTVEIPSNAPAAWPALVKDDGNLENILDNFTLS